MAHFSPIRFNSVSFGPFCPFSPPLCNSIHFGPIQSNPVHLVLFGRIQSHSVLCAHFSPPWSTSVQFSPFYPVRSIWSTLVPFSQFDPPQSNLVQFGLIQSILPISVHISQFGLLRSYSVQLSLFSPIPSIQSTSVYSVHLGLIWSIRYYKWILIDLFCIH